jgi:hypothetical protein
MRLPCASNGVIPAAAKRRAGIVLRIKPTRSRLAACGVVRDDGLVVEEERRA